MRFAPLCLSLMLYASPSWSQEVLGLSAPDEVVQSGLLKYILPRFSLKTGVKVVADSNGPMLIVTEAPGDPVFQRGGTLYFLRTEAKAGQQRFRKWLLSDIGKRTVESYRPHDGIPFAASIDIASIDETTDFEGNAQLGAKLSLTHCGRCHVIGPENRMNGLGSTPSFAVLRSLPDWSTRFQQFYALNPHPAFTQIEGVTSPFDLGRPPPIHPVTITQSELEAILAFVSVVAAADLGAPLQTQ